MTRIIMCGCSGAMGETISGIVKEDAEAKIVAGIDMVDDGSHDLSDAGTADWNVQLKQMRLLTFQLRKF